MNEKQNDKKKQFILVIDDDQGQLDTLSDILESEELQPICCSTGKAALKAVNQYEVNVAILDLRLPDIDGLEVLKRLKKKKSDIKVIINTAYASLESALTAINEEAFAYVKKLGDVEELLNHVHRAFHVHLVKYSEKLESEINKRTSELLKINKRLKKEISERKKTEEKLRESETRFKDVVENSGDWVWESDKDGKFIYSSPVIEELLGYKPEEMVGKYSYEILTPEEQKKWQLPLKEIYTKKESFKNVESIKIHKQGYPVFCESSGVPIFDKNNNFIGYRGTMRDITERKKAAEKLNNVLDLYRFAIENERGVPYRLNYNSGKYDFIGEGCEKIMGIPSSKLTIAKMIKLVRNAVITDNEAKTSDLQKYRKDFLDGKVSRYQVDIQINTPAGDEKWLSDYAVPIKDQKSGEVTGSLGILYDITRRKQAEQELERQSRLSQLFLESLPCVALLITNFSRTIVASNSQAINLGALPGETCYESWRHFDKPCSWCLAPELWAKGTKQHRVVEFLGVIWDIHWIPVDKNTYLHYAFDITERVTLEEKLRQQNKMEAIGQITAGIAHQLNTPLGVVSARLELLFEQFKKEGKKIDAKNIGNLLENVEKMSNIIKGVLSFSRISGSQKEKTDINKAFKEVLALLDSKAKKNKILIAKKLDKNIPMVHININQIEQVFMNIMINAFDALPNGGKLNITNKKTVWKNKHFVAIEFNDSGSGMSKEVMSKLFEPFFTTKPVGKGTGLGMTIAQEIIKEHGGEILLVSKKNMGSKLTVLLPLDVKSERRAVKCEMRKITSF